MQRAHSSSEDEPISEMAIVDTFTQLIFGGEDYNPRELLIIQAFRMVDADTLLQTHRDMGEYLRALGGREMVQLVSRVREQLHNPVEALVTNTGQAAPLDGSGHPAMSRQAH